MTAKTVAGVRGDHDGLGCALGHRGPPTAPEPTTSPLPRSPIASRSPAASVAGEQVVAEGRDRPVPGRRAHRTTALVVSEQLEHRGGDGVGILGAVHDPTGDPVEHGLERPARAPRDLRHPARGRLEEDDPEALLLEPAPPRPARLGEDVRGAEQLDLVALLEASEEVHPGPRAPRDATQPARVAARAGDHERHVASRRRDERHGLDQHVDALARHEAPDRGHERPGRGEPEPRAHRGAARLVERDVPLRVDAGRHLEDARHRVARRLAGVGLGVGARRHRHDAAGEHAPRDRPREGQARREGHLGAVQDHAVGHAASLAEQPERHERVVQDEVRALVVDRAVDGVGDARRRRPDAVGPRCARRAGPASRPSRRSAVRRGATTR